MLRNQLFQLALDAIIPATNVVLEIYHQSLFQVTYKGDQSPVTQADIASSGIICPILEKSGFPVICEETDEIPYQIRKNFKTFWLVDPLDGTKEFINRNGEFTVNIALIHAGKSVLGLISIPVQNSLYLGGVDQPSLKVEMDFKQTMDFNRLKELSLPVYASKKQDIIKVLVSRSHSDKQTMNYLEVLKKQGFNIEAVNAGSSIKFCMIAEGKAELYLRFSPTMEWDTAAGQAIAEAAGAKMYNLPFLKAFEYNKLSLKNEGFIVSPFEQLCKPEFITNTVD